MDKQWITVEIRGAAEECRNAGDRFPAYGRAIDRLRSLVRAHVDATRPDYYLVNKIWLTDSLVSEAIRSC